MLDLRIKILDDEVSSYYKDRNTTYDGDAGMDLYCPHQLIIEPNLPVRGKGSKI